MSNGRGVPPAGSGFLSGCGCLILAFIILLNFLSYVKLNQNICKYY